VATVRTNILGRDRRSNEFWPGVVETFNSNRLTMTKSAQVGHRDVDSAKINEVRTSNNPDISNPESMRYLSDWDNQDHPWSFEVLKAAQYENRESLTFASDLDRSRHENRNEDGQEQRSCQGGHCLATRGS
jgi:hypothetical protein